MLGSMKTHPIIPIALGLALTGLSYSQIDVFGLTQFYPSEPGFTEWNSEHWANGTPREFDDSDPHDPTGWTEDHSSTSTPHSVDGKGVMKMSGSPRFHINPILSEKATPQKFTNIEFTGYYRKTGSSGKNWGGLIVGMRGSSVGHGSPSGDDCDAQSYQARFRNDGKWDFEKEWKHSGTTYYSSEGFGKHAVLWGGEKLPENKWIGMKYILTNVNNDTEVQLRVFIDSTSNGEATNGGSWELVGDVTDDGSNWQGADISGCSYTDPYAPILAGGNVYMRTDGDAAEYKMVSIREIDPEGDFSVDPTSALTWGNNAWNFKDNLITPPNGIEVPYGVKVFDLLGNNFFTKKSISGVYDLSVKGFEPGRFIVRVNHKGQEQNIMTTIP